MRAGTPPIARAAPLLPSQSARHLENGDTAFQRSDRRNARMTWPAMNQGERSVSGTFGEGDSRERGTPAIQVRFSRVRGTVQQGPVPRQKTPIV